MSKTANILNLLHVRCAGIPSFITDDVECTAIYAATDALPGDDVERKNMVLNSFLFNAGNLDGISCKSPSPPLPNESLIIFTTDSRIMEIMQLILNAPHAPTHDEPIEEDQEDPTLAEFNAGTEPEGQSSHGCGW